MNDYNKITDYSTDEDEIRDFLESSILLVGYEDSCVSYSIRKYNEKYAVYFWIVGGGKYVDVFETLEEAQMTLKILSRDYYNDRGLSYKGENYERKIKSRV